MWLVPRLEQKRAIPQNRPTPEPTLREHVIFTRTGDWRMDPADATACSVSLSAEYELQGRATATSRVLSMCLARPDRVITMSSRLGGVPNVRENLKLRMGPLISNWFRTFLPPSEQLIVRGGSGRKLKYLKLNISFYNFSSMIVVCT